MSAVLARRFPRARRIVLPGIGHNNMWSAPDDAVFRALSAFATLREGL
jgi:pimeloyl-ACP methyl ester carboxylesterase